MAIRASDRASLTGRLRLTVDDAGLDGQLSIAVVTSGKQSARSWRLRVNCQTLRPRQPARMRNPSWRLRPPVIQRAISLHPRPPKLFALCCVIVVSARTPRRTAMLITNFSLGPDVSFRGRSGSGPGGTARCLGRKWTHPGHRQRVEGADRNRPVRSDTTLRREAAGFTI